MPVRKLLEYLNENNIKFVNINHSKAFTALEIAHSAHLHGKDLAKTVMVLIDDKMAMIILPASRKVDMELLKKEIGAKKIVLAKENEFAGTFPGCELGAMPPFGNLYGVDVYVDSALTKEDNITFNAGFLTQLLKMKYKDFEKLVKPAVLQL